nr:retrovirus-related Pol polyprotein from transposon TNT 1-94 [Tanacetum cinerariifolium]
MLADSLLPIPFWAEAVNTACYVQNRVLVTNPHNKTLYELLYGRTPSIGFMRPFGCLVTILNTLDPLGKFKGKVDEGFMVGYFVNSKAFRVFNSKTRIVQETLHNKDGDVAFDDKEHEVDTKKPESVVNVSPCSKFEDHSDNNINDVNATGSIVPIARQNSSNSTNSFSAAGLSNTTASPTHGKSLFKDASQLFDNPDMLEMEDITYSDHENVGAETDFNNLKTSITVSPIPTTRTHKDHHVSQIIVRNKARLVTQGYTQEEGIDYEEVFAPVARIEAIRLFLAYASFMGFMVYQMDLMKDKFQMSSMGEVTFFLGLLVKQKKDRIFISQDKYVAEILKKFGLTEEKSASTPIDIEKPLLKDPDVKRIFRYLKGKPHLGLWYPNDSPFDLVAYSDSDYAGASLDKKSTAGGCQFLGCRLISWQCKKQTVVATSSIEAEYVADASCCQLLCTSSMDSEPTAGLWVDQDLEITKLKTRVKKLERANKVKALKLRRLKKVGTFQRVDTSDDTIMKDVSNQGRMIDELDRDEGAALMGEKEEEKAEKVKDIAGDAQVKGRQAEIYQIDMDHASKVLSMQEDEPEVQEVVEVVTTAKLITKIVAAVSELVTAASATIAIVPAATITAAPVRSKDKGKGIMVEEQKPMKKKQQTEAQARRNMIMYLKNTVGFRLDYFKGMSYDDILDEEDVGAEADFSNLETSITISLVLTSRVYKDHPVTQIIGYLSSAPQTRCMTRMVKDQGGLTQINDEDFHTCMFDYFLSQEEPKREEGIDYEESFDPVARIESIRLFLAYASFMGFMVYQMDVKSAFLYGTIEEEVYVCQPPGFEDPDYLDKMSSMGELTFFLGLQVKQKQDGIFISQDKYVAEFLRKFGLTDGKSASTPIDTNKPLLKDLDGEDVDLLQKLRTCMQSRGFLGISRASHTWACGILKIDPSIWWHVLIVTMLTIVATSLIKAEYVAAASCYAQVLWIQNELLDSGLISLQCKKQTVVATSSTEAEYVAAASGCAQVLWMQNQLLDYGVFNSPMLHVLRVEMVINSPWMLSKNWLIQKQTTFGQTATGKESSNPLMAGSLPKTILYSFVHKICFH